MYCQVHNFTCREVCMQRSCSKSWKVCPRCQHHTNHRTILTSDLFDRISKAANTQNQFQSSLKAQLLQLIDSEIKRTVDFMRSYIQESVCKELRSEIRGKQFGCNDGIELAIREYENSKQFKEKYKDRLVDLEFNGQYERQVQREITEGETHRIQTVFFNLLHNLKQSLDTQKSYSKVNNKQDTKEAFYKTRSFSNNSNTLSSTSSSFQRKRKKSTISKHNLFNEVSIKDREKDKVKKIVTNNLRFVEQNVKEKEVNRSQDFLKIMEDKIANRIIGDKYKTQGPLIKEQDYMPNRVNKVQNQFTNQTYYQTQSQAYYPPAQQAYHQPVYQQVYQPVQQVFQLPIEQSFRPISHPIPQPKPISNIEQKQQPITYSSKTTQLQPPCFYQVPPKQAFPSFKQSSKQLSVILHNKQNTRPQRSSIKSNQPSRIESRPNRSSQLKRNSKVSKRVSIIQNKPPLAEDSINSFDETYQLEKKAAGKLIQELQSRLKIVPEVHGFLRQHLLEIQEIWEGPNNVCWRMYFEIKEEMEIPQNKYTDQKDMVREVTYMKREIIQQLQFNIKNTKIKTISKLRNHLIMQYLVKYSAQLLILFEGSNTEQTGFSAEKYLTTLSNLAEGDVKGAFAYMTSNLNKLKQLI